MFSGLTPHHNVRAEIRYPRPQIKYLAEIRHTIQRSVNAIYTLHIRAKIITGHIIGDLKTVSQTKKLQPTIVYPN